MAYRFDVPLDTALGSDGVFEPGAKLNFYQTGTSTPLDTYSDEALSSANANPVVANAAGRFGPIFLQVQSYKVVLTDASDVEIWSADPVKGGIDSDEVIVTPAGNISSTNLQDALEELDSEKVGTSGNNSFTGVQTLSRTDTTTPLVIKSTEAGAGAWEAIKLERDSASPADADEIAGIAWYGDDDGANSTKLAEVHVVFDDVTDGTEDAKIDFKTIIAGTYASRAYIGNGVVIGSPTGGDKGAGTLNATNLYRQGADIALTHWVIEVTGDAVALATGTGKKTFNAPHAMTVTAVRANLVEAQTSGNIVTVDINEAGSTILSTKITIDNNEKTSTTAATAPVVSDTAIADDAVIAIDIDQIGNGTAKGLKVHIIGYPA